MAISGYEKAQITARAGVLRAGTGRAGCVGDSESIFLADEAPNHYAGEFKYTENEPLVPPEDPPKTVFTRVAR